MLTNPSTLGLFDENIHDIAKILVANGGLMYYDGANLNAVCGIARPGDMGFDIVHINLHKTFSQPHGGGGPGGPDRGRERLEPFLPCRRSSATKTEGSGSTSTGEVDRQGARGSPARSESCPLVCVHPCLRSGAAGDVGGGRAERQLSARRLKDAYDLPFDRLCMHEFVLSARSLKRDTASPRSMWPSG